MNLYSLSPVVAKRKKRIGRGIGSGKGGHTASRGQKGQKSREKVGVSFFGTKMKKSLLKRLPMLRGKGKLKPHKKPVVISLSKLSVFSSGSKVNVENLVAKKILKSDESREDIKITGGSIDRALKVEIRTTESARAAIEKAGGEVVGPEGEK